MKIILIFLQIHNENYNLSDLSFIISLAKSLNIDYSIYLREKNQINQDKDNKDTDEIISHISYYNDIHFNFHTISPLLEQYDYMLYLDDNIKNICLLKNCIENSLKILNDDSSLDQVIYGTLSKNFIEKEIQDNKIQIPIIENIELDNYNIFERINDVILDKKNPYKKIYKKEVNYTKLLHKDYPFFNFRLLPSLIRCKKLVSNLKLHTNNLFKNDHFEYMFSQIMEKHNFKSCYLKSNNNLNSNLNTDNNVKKNTISHIQNENGDNTTIVTAFIKLDIKRDAKRSTQKYDYIKKSKDTLSLKQNMVIFVSSELIEDVRNFRKEKNLEHKTKIIEVTQENLYLYDKLNVIEQNVKKNWKPYNIAKYILAVNSRYSFIKQAIESNYFNTDFFAWIDFAAGHTVDISSYLKITYSGIDKIRIGWISRKRNNQFVYNHKCFGGGIFAGHKQIMLEFIKIHNIEFQNIMNMGYCINDDKLLFYIFEKNPHLFDYYCSSYSTLLQKIN